MCTVMDTPAIVVRSPSSGGTAVLSYDGEETLHVSIKSAALCATKQVWLYTDGAELNSFFQMLGEKTASWRDVLSWQSVEQDFVISVTCSPLGQIDFKIILHEQCNGDESWHMQLVIRNDFSALPGIAGQSAIVFAEA